MENQIGIEKDNPLTRMAREAKNMNQDRGALAGRNAGTPTMSMPRVQSSTMREPLPLSPQEIAELDAKASALGITPPDEDADITAFMDSPDRFPSLETPYHPPERSMGSRPTPSAVNLPISSIPKLVDFTKIQGIDLMQGVAYIDGFGFPLPEDDVDLYKRDVISLAQTYVSKKLSEALEQVNNGKSSPQESPPEKVQRVRKRNRPTATK